MKDIEENEEITYKNIQQPPLSVWNRTKKLITVDRPGIGIYVTSTSCVVSAWSLMKDVSGL